jgi:hypothetical protein
MKRIVTMFVLAFSLTAFAGETAAPVPEKAPAGEKSASGEKSTKKKDKADKAKGDKKTDPTTPAK